MSSIIDVQPVLSHIGAIDISSGAGTTMYNIFYNSSITTLGNILMFEYKLIDETADIVPSNIKTGFIATENATNTGITNQWSIAIPAEDEAYNPSTAKKIQVRVYVGTTATSSQSVGITRWSNALDVHNPPPQPQIFSAYYNANSYGANSDDFFIFLDIQPTLDYDEVKFVVAYYYMDNSNNTVWDVSGLLTTSLETIGVDQKQMITVPDFGVVNDAHPNQYVYVSVYAVYPFVSNAETFYAVSQVSEPVSAPAAADYDAPIITSTTYNIYNANTVARSQVINVAWSAPPNSAVPAFVVSKYHIEKSANDVDWTLVDDTIDSNTYDYNVNVSQYSCETTVYFRVTARSVGDTVSAHSSMNNYSHLEIFQYADAPSALTITSISGAANNDVNMTVNFTTPTNNGCGEPIQFNIEIDGSIVDTVAYDGSSTYSYAFTASGSTVTDSGTVRVYLVTEDTNPTQTGGASYDNRDGDSVSTTYVVVRNLEMEPVEYKVYDNPSTQHMILTWDSTIPTGWSGTYTVYKTIDGSNPSDIDTFATNQSTTYTYDSSGNNCNETLGFYVILSITNGSETYETISAPVTKNIFKYADPPSELTITSISGAANNVTMTVNFTTPTNNGCGTPSEFKIDIDGVIVGTVAYNGSANYSHDLVGSNVTDSGTVRVYLVTEDTNPTQTGGASYDNRDGDSVSTTYVVVSDLDMAAVEYAVYDNPSTQHMILTWDSTIPTGWSGTYTVYKTIDGSNPSDIDTFATNQPTTYTYDSSGNNCNETLGFYVILSITNGSETYETISAPVTKNIFKYAHAPEAINVLWASGKIDDNGNGETFVSMDLKMSFENSANTGCGQIYKYQVDVCSPDGSVVLATQEIVYVPDTATPTIYQVSFDDIMLDVNVYTNGIVNVYLKTTDTNSSTTYSGLIGNGPWTVASLPIFIDTVIDDARNNLSFSVVSQTQLTLFGQVIATSGPKSFKLSTTSPSAGITVSMDSTNGTYKYDVTIQSSFIGSAPFPANLIVAVANSIGTDSVMI